MKPKSNCKEVKVFTFPNMVARVYIPDLTPEERTKRMKAVHNAAANLLKAVVLK